MDFESFMDMRIPNWETNLSVNEIVDLRTKYENVNKLKTTLMEIHDMNYNNEYDKQFADVFLKLDSARRELEETISKIKELNNINKKY